MRLEANATEKLDIIAYELIENQIRRAWIEIRRSDRLRSKRVQKLADQIHAELVGRGVSAKILEVIDHGAEKKLASNKTAAGRRTNSRIDVSYECSYKFRWFDDQPFSSP